MPQKCKIVIIGLSKDDEIAVNYVAQDLGYDDIQHLISHNGYVSVKTFLNNYDFRNLADFFLGYGWLERVESFRLQ